MTSIAAEYLTVSLQTFESMKKLADKAMAQLEDGQLQAVIDSESNSIEIIVKHMHGNMLSRWTDFLNSDGEKEWRDRDGEFESAALSRAELLSLWEQGWDVVFATLRSLTEDDLQRTVTIRGEGHSVIQAIQRQVSHYGYHVGQIVFLAKHLRSSDWQTLSIGRGKSKQFSPPGAGRS